MTQNILWVHSISCSSFSAQFIVTTVCELPTVQSLGM
jgi:hypothetical protein